MKKNKIGKVFRKGISILAMIGMVITTLAPLATNAETTTDQYTVELSTGENGRVLIKDGTDEGNHSITPFKQDLGKETVLQVRANDGYFLKDITFTSDNGTKVKPEVSGTAYSFTMDSACNITVKTVFAKESEKPLIKSFSNLDRQSMWIGKTTLEDALSYLPEAVEATMGDMKKQMIPVTWTCADDYENTDYDFYTFDAEIDENKYELASNLSAWDMPYFDFEIGEANDDSRIAYDPNPNATQTLDAYMGAKGVLSWLESHSNDTYYLTTPFGGSVLDEQHCMRPNGDHGSDSPTMNCVGFVGHVFRKCGANLNMIGTRREGHYCNASNWNDFVDSNNIKSYKFDSVSKALNSGVLKKGDLIYFEPKDWDEAGADCHIGFFWGSTSSENKFWHSSDHTSGLISGKSPGNQISQIVAKTSNSYVYVFPITHEYGHIQVQKKSSDTTITSGNENYSLKGATYRIFSDSGLKTCVDTLTCDANGKSNVSKDLMPGTYYVQENVSPEKGYQYSNQVYKVTVTASHTTTKPLVVTASENPKLTSISIEKKSSNTSLTDGNPNYSLEGAVYRIYTNQACTKWTNKSITTDANGKGTITDLPLDEYYLKEYSAPNSYRLDKTVYYVDGRDQFGVNTVKVKMNVKELPSLPEKFNSTIAIQKVDAETGKATPVGNGSLENAQFEVKFYKVSTTTYATKDPATDGKKAARTWILKTDSEGKVYFDNKYKLSGDDFYLDNEGNPTIPRGVLTYREIKSPDGYLINPEIIVVPIKPGSNDSEKVVYVTPKQPEQALTLNLVKTQAGTTTPIPGAVFEHTLPDGSKETKTTDENGKIAFQGLQHGNHTIKETSVPDGYAVNANQITFTVADDNTITITSSATETDLNGNITLTVESDGTISAAVEDKLAPFDLHINKINNKNTVLKGAEFTLYSDEGCQNAITSGVTDSKGDLTFEDLIPGKTYYMKETKAPQGYRIPVNSDGSDIVYKVKVDSCPVNDKFEFYVNDKAYTTSSTGQFTVSGTKAERIVNMIITNEITNQLPVTGSTTTLIMFMIGVLLTLAGIIGVKVKFNRMIV